MNKILLIIQREYLSRVKKKSFLLVTFLLPLFFMAAFAGIIYLTKQSFDNQHAVVKFIDQSGTMGAQLKSNTAVTFESVSEMDTAGEAISQEKARLSNADAETYLLIIPKDLASRQSVELFSSAKAGIGTQNEIRNQLETALRNQQLEGAGIDVTVLKSIDPKIKVTAKELTTEGEKDSHTDASMGIAIALSVVIYISLFLYGSQVMRGIIEEKNNRIVEVIISSVRPFQLMMGKIIGIGLVGITQFLLWIVLSTVLMSVGSTAFMAVDPGISTGMEAGAETAAAGNIFEKADNMLDSVDFTKLISCFLLFFTGGYLLYSALFAAVGSAVDNETETQQFMLPITMPLLFTYILSFGVLINDPNGTLAVWLSMIPFTSPIAMLVRIPFGVPDWQILLSLILLGAGFIFTTWVAGRIYRVGILMYGKKASFKELFKWFRYRA